MLRLDLVNLARAINQRFGEADFFERHRPSGIGCGSGHRQNTRRMGAR